MTPAISNSAKIEINASASLSKRAARQRFQGRRKAAFDVGDRQPDGLGSEIKANQAGLRGKAQGKVFKIDRDGSSEKRLSTGREVMPRSARLSEVCAQMMAMYRGRAPFFQGLEEYSMSVDLSAVRRIAHLARIGVSEAEIPHLQDEINAILKFVEALEQVDVEGVEPMTSVIPMRLPMRDDVVTDGGIADEVLANAPLTEDGFFVVPKVIE